jgi:hypothetical protein
MTMELQMIEIPETKLIELRQQMNSPGARSPAMSAFQSVVFDLVGTVREVMDLRRLAELLIRWRAHDGGTVPKTPLKTRWRCLR